VDEARKVISRLERIEALQSSLAPAEQLLGEVRQLLSEGEAWLAAERDGARRVGRNGRGDGAGQATEGPAGAHACSLESIEATGEVVPETAGARD
jgi:hypothetical protein